MQTTEASLSPAALAGGLATRLRNDIVSGALPPGTKLSIDELRARYGQHDVEEIFVTAVGAPP